MDSFGLEYSEPPLIQPVVKEGPLSKRLSEEGNLDLSAVNSLIDGASSFFDTSARSIDLIATAGTSGSSDSHDNSLGLLRNIDIEGTLDGQKEGVSSDLSGVVPERQKCISTVNKGLCHRCLKGSRFTEKEACLVCSAQYCYKCVLRAMGSMPEGRKCITCIGYRIDESKRSSLGKSSRLLKRLHTNMRAKEIMEHEVSCKANQLPPELICVNGKPLSYAELFELLGCPNPPRKLKLKRYWYDKVSGLWGKEGKKPCQIISPQLSVGGQIMPNASSGNSHVWVNNREITRPELWMLQLAGINCDGGLHFWMSADGSLQEEGSNYVRKQILSKPTSKLVSAILSLPIPFESPISGDEVNSKVGLSSIEKKTIYKLLMVGSETSGASAIFKQAKILYNDPFSEDERRNIKFIIQSKLYNCIAILLQSKLYNFLRIMFQDCERVEGESFKEIMNGSIDQPGLADMQNPDQIANRNMGLRIAEFSDLLHEVMMSSDLESIFPIATREFAPLVEELWKDRAFQASYNRRNEVQMLPQDADFYLDRAVEISRTNYEPSIIDILHADRITSFNGIASMEFSCPMSLQERDINTARYPDPSNRCQLLRVHPSSLGKNCKWLSMFEDVDLFIYCVSLTDYSQFSYDINGVATNKMLEHKKFFETIVTHPGCASKNFLLILTKFDLFEEMMEQFPVTQCEWFNDFNPVTSRYTSKSIPQHAFHYIATKFKELFGSLTGNRLFVSLVAEQEADSIDKALKYAREVLGWDYVDKDYVYEDSFYSDSSSP